MVDVREFQVEPQVVSAKITALWVVSWGLSTCLLARLAILRFFSQRKWAKRARPRWIGSPKGYTGPSFAGFSRRETG